MPDKSVIPNIHDWFHGEFSFFFLIEDKGQTRSKRVGMERGRVPDSVVFEATVANRLNVRQSHPKYSVSPIFPLLLLLDTCIFNYQVSIFPTLTNSRPPAGAPLIFQGMMAIKRRADPPVPSCPGPPE